LDYAVNRYALPGSGTFLSVDHRAGSTNDPGSWNKYAYASGDPVNGRDPRGLYTCFFVDGVIDGCEDDGNDDLAASSECQIAIMSGNITTGIAYACGITISEQEGAGDTQGGSGGGGPWNGRGTLTNGNGDFTYVNLLSSGMRIDDLRNGLALLSANLDLANNSDCKNWLSTGLAGQNIGQYIANLKIAGFDSVITTGTHMYVSAEAVAHDAGYDILFGSSVGAGIGGFAVFVHELAHLLNAPGFQGNDGEHDANGVLTDAAKQRQLDNAKALAQHCGGLSSGLVF
jgi:hypothetical protein